VRGQVASQIGPPGFVPGRQHAETGARPVAATEGSVAVTEASSRPGAAHRRQLAGDL
jgi:hypothetical protein